MSTAHHSPASPARAGYVGRAGLQELLARSVSDCRAGRGGILLLEGEAGIGKTRTLGLLQSLAGSAGLESVWGRCSEVPGAPALLPWTEILGRLGAAGEAGPAPEVAGQDEHAQFQVFRTVTDQLVERARTQPLLVLLDDVHAADLASLRLLSFLAREAQEAPLLVAAACRQTDVPGAGPLREVLDDVRRRARVAQLHGLAEEDVARLAATVGGGSVHGTVAHALFERTLGNPLFATQLVESLLASGRDLSDPAVAGEAAGTAPAGVASVLRDRLHRLDAPDLAILRRAAVLGREFDDDLLEREDAAAADIARALAAAAAAEVLEPVADSPGRWRFPHVLFRDVLYDEQEPAQRLLAHRELGAAIEARRDLEQDLWLTSAAHHSVQAMDAGHASATRTLALRAGERALARCAHEAAITWFEAALRAHDLDIDGSDADELTLCLRLATALWRAGQPEAARADYARAITLARARGDGVAFAEAAVGSAGRTDAVLGLEEESAALLEEALELLGPEPSRLRVDTLTRLATALYFSSDETRRDAVSLEAIACAEALGDPGALGYALTARRYLLARPGQLGEREAVEARTLQVLENRPEDPATVIARYQSVVSALERGDFAALDHHLAIHARLAARLREPFLTWQAAALKATRVLAAGDLNEGEALAHRAREQGEQSGSPNAFTWFSGQLYGIRRAQGRLGELEPLLADLNTRHPDVAGYGFAHAEACLALERESEVRAFLTAARANGFRDLPNDFNWLSLVAIGTRCILALRDTEAARDLHEVMAPARGACIVMPFGSLWDGAVTLYLGQLATLLGRFEDAARDLEDAATLHARIGARAHLAETWLAQARLQAAVGERAEAGRLGTEAATVFRELGMQGAEKEAEALARPVSATRAPGATHSWKHRGSHWRIRYGDEEASFRDSLGMAYLAALLAQPTEPLHVLDLTARRGDPAATDSGELLDQTARNQVRARMNDLVAELDDAEARHDLGRAEAVGAELQQLEEELARALGLGGRARRMGDPVERARKSVYNRIQAALKNLDKELPELAQHLRHSVRTGRTCVYAPEGPVSWVVDA
ncbi:MAG: AAA family ATPase [Myxococcales bacterium]|nr:AAA family ATPase [Myxococcales bacterium]